MTSVRSPKNEKSNFLNFFITAFWRWLIPLCFVALAVSSLLALQSFSISDSSWNTVSATPIKNITGKVGAIFADLVYQSFGMASYVIPLLFSLWSVARMRAEVPGVFSSGFCLRVVLGGVVLLIEILGAMIIIATLIAYIAPDALNNGLIGGKTFAWLQDKLGAQALEIVLPGLGILAALLLIAAARLSWHDYTFIACGLGTAVIWLLTRLYRGVHRGFGGGRHRKTPDAVQARPSREKQPQSAQGTVELRKPFDAAPRVRVAPSLDPLSSEGTSSRRTTKLPKIESEAPKIKPESRVQLKSVHVGTTRHGNASVDFQLPTLDLLNDPLPPVMTADDNDEHLQDNARRLEQVLSDFKIRGEIQRIRPGPVVTMYELEPEPGTKTSKIINLSDDIARTMRAVSVRIATIPGHSALGIELPNEHREMVNMKEILAAESYQKSRTKLPMILGKTINGAPLIVDLATMPHLLIAGTTGSGKSVGLNVMLLSILYRLNPDQCRVIMIDPKMLEFSVYDGIPHLLTPVVTEPKQAVVALKWTVREMENRYRLMSKVGVRNIDGYNARVSEALAKGTTLSRKVQTGIDPETGQATYDVEELPTEIFPLIVVVVDEMADLMIVAGKDIEASIQRLAQMARAAGIHLIMATQRPSVDVITGTIKANFPTRISYRVTSKIDSRTIIGEQGAEQLLGKGDLLLMLAAGNITRVHAPFVEDKEVERICDWLRAQRPVRYLEAVTDEEAITSELGDVAAAMFEGEDMSGASLYDQAVAVVARHQKASTSFVQRQLRIGYNRAADLIDEMERNGIISSADHKSKREVLIDGGGE